MASMSDRDGLIWFDGKMVPWRDANIHVLTHSLHYGMSVFEGVRAYSTDKGAAIFRLKDHTRRLFDSAHIMDMDVPYSQDEINEVHRQVVRENDLPEAYVRPLIFYGSEGMGLRAEGLKVHVMVAAWEWPSYMSPELLEKGITLRTSSFTRHHVNISMTRAKAGGHYINSMLALKEAIRGGADEAMLLDPEGYVAEGTGENLFIVRDGVIYTPELTACLNGITRRTLNKLARDKGYEIVEKRITRDEVYIADEAFMTGTAAEVTPIREVDNRQIGAGRRGPVTEVLQSTYFDVVRGKLPEYKEWLTVVK